MLQEKAWVLVPLEGQSVIAEGIPGKKIDFVRTVILSLGNKIHLERICGQKRGVGGGGEGGDRDMMKIPERVREGDGYKGQGRGREDCRRRWKRGGG